MVLVAVVVAVFFFFHLTSFLIPKVLSPFYLNHRSNHNPKGYVHSIPLCVTLNSKSEGFGSRFSCFLSSSNSLSKSDAIFQVFFFFNILKGWDEK
jgi:hypothetical protein